MPAFALARVLPRKSILPSFCPEAPQLAARYPDKGAFGWVVRAELANEGGKDGLALTVEWDRDPGKGFCWIFAYRHFRVPFVKGLWYHTPRLRGSVPAIMGLAVCPEEGTKNE